MPPKRYKQCTIGSLARVTSLRRVNELKEMIEAFTPEHDVMKVKNVLEELGKIHVTELVLKETKVGFSVNALRKRLAGVETIQSQAKKLLVKWKKQARMDRERALQQEASLIFNTGNKRRDLILNDLLRILAASEELENTRDSKDIGADSEYAKESESSKGNRNQIAGGNLDAKEIVRRVNLKKAATGIEGLFIQRHKSSENSAYLAGMRRITYLLRQNAAVRTKLAAGKIDALHAESLLKAKLRKDSALRDSTSSSMSPRRS